MADHVLEARIWLARPRAEIFAVFADPRNLAWLTPRRFRVRLLTPVTQLAAGAVLDFRLAWLGIPLRWRSYIREYDPPHRFVDVQVRGPWARWEHRHLFLEENGGTWVRSEEHTSELQSRFDLVCRLLLEKKKKKQNDLQ